MALIVETGMHRGRLEQLCDSSRSGCQVTAALAERVHAAGLKLATWVVDEPEELRQLARFVLYEVGSNRPGVLIDAIADGLLD